MKANTVENLILDEIFRIQPMDLQFAEYLEDCFGPSKENEN